MKVEWPASAIAYIRELGSKLRRIDRECMVDKDRLFRERVRQVEKSIWLRVGEPVKDNDESD
jgi:hypothetical protein